MKKDLGNLFLIILVLIMILSLNSFAVTEQTSESRSHATGALKQSIWDEILPDYSPEYYSFTRPGDFDTDGFITAADAEKCSSLIERFSQRGEDIPVSVNRDCNSDGRVDEDDVSEILRTACRILEPRKIKFRGRKGDTFYTDALTSKVGSGCTWTASCDNDSAEITVESKGVPENNPYSYESFLIKFVPKKRGKYTVTYECKNKDTGYVAQAFTVVYKIR